jgi:hypothetical protein
MRRIMKRVTNALIKIDSPCEKANKSRKYQTDDDIPPKAPFIELTFGSIGINI